MCRLSRKIAHSLVAVFAFAFVAGPVQGQVTVFSTGGFEAPTYSAGSILLQQGFVNAPLDVDSGRVQTATTRTGGQAFQAVGANFAAPGFSGTGANFWYKDSFTYNPVGSGTPFVQARFSGLMAAGGIDTIPAAGIYLEGKTAGGTAQSLATVMFGSQGQLIVSTNAATGGASQTASSTTGQFASGQWHDLLTEMNFSTQTYRVYREGNPSPIQFQNSGGQFITDIPFRNTNGTTVTVFEIGMLAYNFSVTAGSETAPSGSLFVDNYDVTASATSLAPVPEPGLVLATAAVGLGLVRATRRRPAA